jgi:methylglutaconyl-CoA hydratase
MTYQYLDCRQEGAVHTVSLNRPQLRNAFNDGVIRELTEWAEDIAEDGSVRVIVLRGRGKAFCAGADLDWMRKTAEYSREEHIRDAKALGRMLEVLDRLPKALIAAVHGAAVAGGIGLLSVCDIVVSAEDAVFGFTEVNLGIVPAVISPYVVARIGPSAARELFVTGSRFGASRAREVGLVHAVVPVEELDRTVGHYVEELRTSAPGAVAAAKKLIRTVSGRPAGDTLHDVCEILADRRASDEARAGIAAFLSKQPPPWAGPRE